MKIQIHYASIGSGHRIAAGAIKHALALHDNVYVEMIDILDPIKTDLVKISDITSLLSFLIAPNAYDKAWQTGNLQGLYNLICEIDILQKYLLDSYMAFRPDIAVFTHSLPCSIFCKIKDSNQLTIPIIAVATDFSIHPYWPLECVTQFVVGSDIGLQELRRRGLENNKIHLFGIPINPQFMGYSRKPQIRNDTAKNILILAGGRQVAPYIVLWPKIVTIIRSIVKWRNYDKLLWTVVSGANPFFEKHLSAIANDTPNIVITRYIEEIAHQLFHSDIVMTKPGGLILAECMALRKPVVLLTHGAGQEAANAGYLLERQAALILDDPVTTPKLMSNILATDEIIRLSHNAGSLGYPYAAEEIAQHILTFQ